MVANHQGGGYQGGVKSLSRGTRSEVVKVQRRRFLQLAGAATILPICRGARADTWPSRILKLEVGFPPGGGLDSAGRIVANRPGAGGRIAMDAAAHAEPDGYTVLLAPGSPAVNSLLFDSLSFDPLSL